MSDTERILKTFTSLVAYYGFSEGHYERQEINRDKNGIPIQNRLGYLTSTVSRKSKVYPCRFSTEEEALAALSKVYQKVVARNSKHTYPCFEDCLRVIESECMRVHPEMHGVKLVMKPLD